MALSTWARDWKLSLDRRWALHQALRRKAVARGLVTRPRLEALEDRMLLSAYVVNTTADSGTGSLRDAINQVNAGSYNEIDFNIGTVGSAQTISPTSQLPTLTANGVFINGLSQGGSGNTKQLITLDGTNAGSSSFGLWLEGSGTIVSGLIVEHFFYGIQDFSSSNTIGGTTTGAGNVVSGNTSLGVEVGINASGVVVEGNFIGTDVTGDKAVGNSIGIGVAGSHNTIGGTASGARNVVSGNSTYGIDLFYNAQPVGSNLVEGNYIGTNASGTGAVPNAVGLYVSGFNNIIGGTVYGSYNVVSGNSSDGVVLDDEKGTLVEGNYIGITPADAALGNSGNGIFVDGYNDTIGGSVSGAANSISGNSKDGVLLYSTATGNLVEGDYIGVNKYDEGVLGNSGNGIEVGGGSNTVGASYAVAPNVISGNSSDGVLLDSTSIGNVVLGNYIGTDHHGTVARANKIGIEDAGTSNTIGGSVVGARNLISANTSDGVLIDSSATAETMEDNEIGTALTGDAPLANGTNGVEIQGAKNTIGGNSVSNYYVRNFISGNGNDGVLFDSTASSNQVLGNFIGVAVNGTAGVANAANGIEIIGSSNTIGSATSGNTNFISGNSKDGVLLDNSTATGNLVLGNDVGTDYTGKNAVANSLYGVSIAGSNNTVGGSATGAGNAIAYNKSGGVLVSTGSGNTISRNSIFANGPSNTGLGITLDSGANNNIVAPTLNSATLSGSTLTVTGTFSAPTANVAYVLEFFANPTGDPEGKIYLGSLKVTPATTGTQNFTFTTMTSVTGTDPVITATLTDASGDTSEFSNGETVT